MGIYNRDYYRDLNAAAGRGDWGIPGLTPAVKYLILANVVVFLLQIFVLREEHLTARESIRKYNPQLDKILREKEEEGPDAVEELKKKYPPLAEMLKEDTLRDLFSPTHKVPVFQQWLELDANKVVYQGQVWRLLTHAFCHDRYDIFHIVINMLLLFWFGCTLESMYGTREFLLFYLTSALVGALAFTGLELYMGTSTPAIGASGAVMGVMMLYTMHFPCEYLYVLCLIPIQMRFVMALYLIWDLHPVLLALTGDRLFTGVAHAAHLGGLAFGFFYKKFDWRLAPALDWVQTPKFRWRRRPRLRIAPLPDPEPEPQPGPQMDRVDEVLQKILDSGQASLTAEERAILQEASARLKKRR